MTCDTQCSVGIACVEGIRDDAEKCCFVIVCALHKWEDWLQLMLVSTIPMNPHPRAAVFCRNNVNSSGLSCRLNPLGFYNTKQKVVFVSRTGGACPKVSFTGTCVSCRPLFGRVVGVKKWCRVCWVDFQTLFFNPFSGMTESWLLCSEADMEGIWGVFATTSCTVIFVGVPMITGVVCGVDNSVGGCNLRDGLHIFCERLKQVITDGKSMALSFLTKGINQSICVEIWLGAIPKVFLFAVIKAEFRKIMRVKH